MTSIKNDDNGFYNHCSLNFLNDLDEDNKLISLEPFEQLLNEL